MIIIETIAHRNPPPIRELAPTPIESGLTQEESFVQEEPKGFAKTIQFIEKALAEGAHLKKPFWVTGSGNNSIIQISEDVWVRQKNIVGVYFGSPATLEDLGRMYGGITRERVRQLVKTGVQHLWQNCSTKTQAIFPFEELELNKPRPQKTKEVIVFSKNHVESKSPHQKNEELIRNLKKAKTDKEKQHILDQIPYGLYQQLSKGDTPLLTPVKTLVMEAGDHPRRPHDYALFTAAIRTREVPMGEIQRKTKVGLEEVTLTYRFIYTEDQKRAKEALLKNEHLKLFFIHPVQQVAGPKQDQLPTTALIRNQEFFGSIYSLLFELGSTQISRKEHFAKLFEKPELLPAPVFHHEDRYKYPVERYNELKVYAANLLHLKVG